MAATKQASLALLGLLFLTAAALTGATVFFQQRFDNINQAYQEKLDDLNKVSKELEARQAALETTQEELQLKTEREEEFSQRYTEVRDVKETLEQELARTQEEKRAAEFDLGNTRIALTETNATLQARLLDIQDLNSDVIKLENDLDDCEDELETCCGT